MIIKIDKDKRHEAGHDKLTGLCNPEHLMQKMKELPDKKKNRLIIYSDIAEFKLINEIFGIEKGNEILLKQADIIKKHAVDGYLYGRVGEDHFVVIVDEATFNEEHLYECRETLQNVLSDSVYNVRVCFGIYRTDNMNESLSFMCDKASFAVASIKDDTHSFIAYYDDTMLEAAIKYKTIVDEFDDAIKASEFKMYLQPQISAKTRRLTGAEALVRRIKPDVPNLMGELEELRKAGFTIEMDDFGRGYSSLNTLKDINVDVLKVDMGFIKETKNVKKSRIILASVIKMAKELNLLIITEGVETEEQVDNLTKLGCDVFQGYYFFKAIDVNEFEKRYLYRKKAG
jgi:diguanylate cyclase (GGDEF)-like protein